MATRVTTVRPHAGRGRPGLPVWLPALGVVLLVALGAAEIAVLVAVAKLIGLGWTLLLLIAESAAGAWIVKHEGLRAWQALRSAFSQGRFPDRQLVDGALVVTGGALLLAPGFLTDLLGFLLVLPFTRPAIRSVVMTIMHRRARGLLDLGRTYGGLAGGTGPTVEGEVVDSHDEPTR